MNRRAGLAAVAVAFALFLTIPFVSATASNSYTVGYRDLRNGTVNIGDSSISFTNGTSAYNTVNFTGNINGTTLIWVADNVWISNTSVNPATTSLNFSPGVAMMNWAVYYYPDTNTVIVRSNMGIPTAASIIDFSSYSTLFFQMYGIFGYIPILLFPITIYLKTKSTGALAITLLFMAAAGGVGTGVGIFLPDVIRPFVVLAISLAIGVLLYKIFWGQEQ